MKIITVRFIIITETLGYLIDSIGTKIQIGEDLNGVKEKNLSLYVADLFESYYEIVDKFNRDCRLDKTEDIIWS